MNNNERIVAIRIALAKHGLNYKSIASQYGFHRQNINRIAIKGHPGEGCRIRQTLAQIVGVHCEELWGCSDKQNQEQGDSVNLLLVGDIEH